MTSAQDLVTALANAGLLNHLNDNERNLLNERSVNLELKAPYQTLDFLKKIPDLIWYFRFIPEANTRQELLTITRQHTIPQAVLQPDPLAERLDINSINARLQKLGQPHRYYFLLEPDDGENGPDMKCAVIFMDDTQRFRSDLHKHVTFDYNQPHTWTELRVSDILNIFKDTHRLSDIDEITIEAQFKEILAEISSNARFFEHDFFRKFDLIYEFDVELYKIHQEEYEELLADLVNFIDNARFKPTNLKVTSDEEYRNYQMSFELNNHQVQMALTTFGWLDVNFIRLVNEHLVLLGIDGQLYSLHAVGQVMGLIYLTQNQYEQLSPYFSLYLP